MARVSQMEQDIYMQNQLLRDTDYMSMWHSVEVRLPFLDRRMMELCSRIHPAVRFYGKRPKQLLTDAFPQLLPRAIWDRKKMGFTFPLGKWMEGVSINGAVHPRLFRYRSLLQSGHMQWSRYWAYLLSTGQPVTTRPASKRILFAALKIFSATGGIEKFNRSFAKALAENAISHGWQVTIASAYDKAAHNLYFPTAGFAGFASKRLRFTRTMLQWTRHYDTCIIGHINLSVIVAAGKMANPNCRFILIAHGIEMWKPLPWIQRTALHECRQIWSVSQFTRSNILQHNRIDADRISIFPNTIDPYFVQAKSREDVNILRQQLGIQQQSQIVLTVARLATTEQYKGYDHVFHVLPALRRQFPQLIYILAGTGDKQELSRLKQMASELEISDAVLFTGFVPDDQLPLYYALADVFAMPSRKEGFGIVFLEAAYTGLRVVAGNADGSPEALLQGQLGSLIAPDDEDALVRTISEYLTQPPLTPEAGEAQRQLIESHFGFRVFKNRQAKMLEQL
jgi:glycosyltransferase involved in cell wall biosynthesis